MGKYSVIHSKKEGFAVIKYKKNLFSKAQWGIDDDKEMILFTGEFEDIIVLNSNLIARKVKVEKDKFKWELAKKSGERICPPKYDECPDYIIRIWTSECPNNYFYIAPVNGLYTIIDGTGRQLCKPKYERIERNFYGNGFLMGRRGNYYYSLNKKGAELERLCK